MTLTTGTRAPAFQAEDIFGAPLSLSDYAGKALLLAFFRNAACALCNLRVHQLIQRYPAYQAQGLEIVAIFESPRASILQHVGKQSAPFPIVADPQAKLYTLYEVETSESKIAKTMSLPETQQRIGEAAALGFSLIKEPDSNFNRIPAEFLIGPDSTLQLAHYAEHVTDHLPFEALEHYLSRQMASGD